MKPLVSVIIVSYNTCDLTVRSIKSVYDSDGFQKKDIQIIVVDNASTDNSVKMVKKSFPEVEVIENSENKGFGTANNQGVNRASGKYILLLNSDAFLIPDSLRRLVDKMEHNPKIGAVGPQLVGEKGEFQMSAGYFPTIRRVVAWMWWLDKIPGIKMFFRDPYHVFDPEWYGDMQHPDWLMGACILMRRNDFDRIGGFDEQIFMYGEEVELFLRLERSSGKANLFAPDISVVHVGSASTTKAAASRLVQELRGIEYIYHKHYPKKRRLLKWIMNSGVRLRIALFSLIPHRRSVVQEYVHYVEHNHEKNS